MSEIIKVDQQETLAITREHYEVMTAFVKEQMEENVDFGVVPGTNSKPTLFKPGAEKLCRLLNLNPTFSLINSIINFDKPIFYYHYQCSLYHKSQLVGQGDGSCNSYEKKYRYRKAELTCPICGQPTVIKGKEEYGGGYVCYKKKGGCGARFKDNDERIINQDVGLIENPDIFDQVNTIQKMAEKRALIAAVLCSVGASQFFTQDLEDMNFDEPKQTSKVRNAPPLSTADPAGIQFQQERGSAFHALNSIQGGSGVKNITPQSSSNNGNSQSAEHWYEKGKKDAEIDEEMKHPKVKPYVEGYNSWYEKGKKDAEEGIEMKHQYVKSYVEGYNSVF